MNKETYTIIDEPIEKREDIVIRVTKLVDIVQEEVKDIPLHAYEKKLEQIDEQIANSLKNIDELKDRKKEITKILKNLEPQINQKINDL